MKVRLERDVLAEAVQWAARSLPLRPSVPILAGLLVRADAEGVTFSSFDYETSAQDPGEGRGRRRGRRAGFWSPAG